MTGPIKWCQGFVLYTHILTEHYNNLHPFLSFQFQPSNQSMGRRLVCLARLPGSWPNCRHCRILALVKSGKQQLGQLSRFGKPESSENAMNIDDIDIHRQLLTHVKTSWNSFGILIIFHLEMSLYTVHWFVLGVPLRDLNVKDSSNHWRSAASKWFSHHTLASRLVTRLKPSGSRLWRIPMQQCRTDCEE